jgi:hypothetical protein
MPTCSVCNHAFTGSPPTCPGCGARRSTNSAASTVTAAALFFGLGGIACTEEDGDETTLDTGEEEVSADEYAGADAESPFETESGGSTSETGESSDSTGSSDGTEGSDGTDSTESG